MISVFIFSVLFMISCTPKNNDDQKSIAKEMPQPQIEIKFDDQLKKISKHIRFAASIDQAILKTIRPNLNISMTQFEVLNTILEQNQGIKKNFGAIDCKSYQIEKTLNQISFFKTCQNPKVLIAKIDSTNEKKIKLIFYSKEWSYQIGASVALTSADRVCDLMIDQDKLIRMQCENTSLELDKDMSEIQELRLADYVFDQKAKDQVRIQGGFYKNLVMHRKLLLSIPFDGKIKIIEKELKVRDDFIEIEKPKVEIKPEIKLEKIKNEDIDANESSENNEIRN